MNEDFVRDLWTRGDYGIVGDWFAAASRACLDDIALAGRTLLDVACGTGAVALEAARRGAIVTGVDLTPAMLVEARRRADAAKLAVTLHEGSFTALGRFGAHDVVTSAFGVIFAADPVQVAGELVAACHPDGIIAVAAWTAGGAFGSPPDAFAALLPPRPGPSPYAWATRDGIEGYFNPHGARLDGLRTATLGMPFASVEAALDAIMRYSGPWQMMFEVLAERGHADEGRAIMLDHLARFAVKTPDGVRIDAEYAIVRVRRDGRR